MCRNTFPRLALIAALAALVAAACTDRPVAPRPDARAQTAPAPPLGAERARLDGLARALALALRAPAARAQLQTELDASPYREHKVHFQRLVARRTVALPASVAGQADSAIPLELYLPVPAHRAAWHGDGRVLVATALADHDAPVAFDTAGTRYLLSADVPPPIPVIALVPVETDFAPAATMMMCYVDCNAGGGSGGDGGDPAPSPTPGLYLTQAHFTQTFEGWLKGSPEFEIHVLGQKGQTDSLLDYQCAGEHQLAPYYFDQNTLDWSGSVLLFSQAQLDAYKAQHPGQSVRVYAVEDDDTACQIKTDAATFQTALALGDSLYKGFTGGTDTTLSSTKAWWFAPTLVRFINALASLINTNDELVGNAVQDSIAGEYHAGYNWIVKGAQNVTNGWIRLEMR